jgi:hypothetical protein
MGPKGVVLQNATLHFATPAANCNTALEAIFSPQNFYSFAIRFAKTIYQSSQISLDDLAR